jgi:hypothetical protein
MSELEIVIGAFQVAAPNERKAWLDRESGDDPALRRRVDDMLEALRQAGALLERPASSLTESPYSSNFERPGSIIATYKLLEQIGEGGFGVVFAAEQSAPIHQKVALKKRRTASPPKSSAIWPARPCWPYRGRVTGSASSLGGTAWLSS